MTTQTDTIAVAVIGCGNIAKTYCKQIAGYPQVRLLGFADLDAERASAYAEEYQATAYGSIDELLADPAVDLVLNLTIHHAHAAVIRQCLEAGKHVLTEKPLALSYADAAGLVQLAKDKGLRLGSAPIVHMGEAQATMGKLIRDGKLGTPRLAYAEINHGRIERWHPNPEPFYDVGVLWDVGVYPLTLLTTWFGPATSVQAMGRVVYPDRITKEGRPFTITAPDFALAGIQFANGAFARLSANFYVCGGKQGGSMEVIGDDGMAALGMFQNFAASVEYAKTGEQYEAVDLLRPGNKGTEYGRAIDEMSQAILENRPHRASAEQAAHVCEILEAIYASIKSDGKTIELTSTCTPPAPLPWAE